MTNPIFEVAGLGTSDGDSGYVRTNRFAWKRSRLYRWSLDVRTTKTNSAWFAEYRFSGSNEHLKTIDDNWRCISSNASSFRTKPETCPTNASLGQVCLVAPGEPSGHCSITIFVDNTPVHTIRFEVYGPWESVNEADEADRRREEARDAAVSSPSASLIEAVKKALHASLPRTDLEVRISGSGAMTIGGISVTADEIASLRKMPDYPGDRTAVVVSESGTSHTHIKVCMDALMLAKFWKIKFNADSE